MHGSAGAADLLRRLTLDPRRQRCVTHVERLPARPGELADWPTWADPLLVSRLRSGGVHRLWAHQRAAADLVWSGRSTVVATGTASGKSLAYLLPVLTTLLGEPSARALYIAPTKALARDQLAAVRRLALAGVRAASYDGDTPREDRDWVRRHASYVHTNPDMLSTGVLPQHARWAGFLRGLRYVVIDECHHYRGVFGSHVAQVLRRLRRVCARYGAEPVFVLASATVADPGTTAGRLTGLDVAVVDEDASKRPALTFALYEPPLTELLGEQDAPVRRSAVSETADLLSDLVADGVPTLAFLRSRRGAELCALAARRNLLVVEQSLADRVAAYRAGYLPEERRALEADLRSGRLLGLASTNALELGIDVSGLDAVVVAGFPGTLASLWQQAGRAGRTGGSALTVLVARDDPLDTYLVHHPEAVFGRPVEAAVLDPDNPHVLTPHLECAAAELPLTEPDLGLFGPLTPSLVDDLVRRGRLRRRPAGWFWTSRERPGVDLRSTGGAPIAVVEEATGRLLGTADRASAFTSLHPGAHYLHQGQSYVVHALDLEASAAFVEAVEVDWTTTARVLTDLHVVEAVHRRSLPDPGGQLAYGTVDVTRHVVGFVRRRMGSGELLGDEPLDLPPQQLRTKAVWYTLSPALLERAELAEPDVPGAAHAAEHAAIGLLPLWATCDRWDIGGVSTALHPDLGLGAVFVYDGAPGGAGFAERGFKRSDGWLAATRDTITSCECLDGCPSCVQSPKCGNGNDPLDKAAAVRLLTELCAGLGG